jgi:putative phage-type endonuclease
MIEQRSDEWFASRLGKVTASRVADVMTKTKTGYGASRKNYMAELLCQRLTGKSEDHYTNSAMQRGTDLEPVARFAYEMQTDLLVEEVGLIDHPTIEMFAASPDGFVGDVGMIEIKCPNTATHIEFLQSETPDSRYQWQMLCQMACAGRQWCDFVSYDDRLPEYLQLKIVRFERNDTRILEMETEVKLFLKELNELQTKLEGMKP